MSQVSSRLVRLLNMVPYFKANPRLTSTEATGILVALRALLDVPGMVDPRAARSAIAKIESAVGTAGAAGNAGLDELGSDEAESASAAAVRDAVRTGKALALEYHSASHDTVSSRIVDPIRVV